MTLCNNIYICQVVFIFLTILLYVSGVLLKKKTGIRWIHPFFFAAILLTAFVIITDFPYNFYKRINSQSGLFLGVCMVALGWEMYNKLDYIKSNFKSLIISVVTGGVVSMLTVSLTFMIIDVPSDIVKSILPSSSNTIISTCLSESVYGIPSLTILFVVLTGIFGALSGPFILRKIGVTSIFAKDVALGCGTHEIGFELGLTEGVVSGIVTGFSGVITAFLFPLYVGLFY